MAWQPGEKTTTRIATGPQPELVGRYDGIQALPDGRIIITSWQAQSVLELDGKQLKPLLTDLPEPSDVAIDAAHSRLAVSLFRQNEVRLYQLP